MIVEYLLNHPRNAMLISVIVGVLTGAIGITLSLNSEPGWRRSLGGALLVLGMLTPILPWWLLFLI